MQEFTDIIILAAAITLAIHLLISFLGWSWLELSSGLFRAAIVVSLIAASVIVLFEPSDVSCNANLTTNTKGE